MGAVAWFGPNILYIKENVPELSKDAKFEYGAVGLATFWVAPGLQDLQSKATIIHNDPESPCGSFWPSSSPSETTSSVPNSEPSLEPSTKPSF